MSGDARHPVDPFLDRLAEAGLPDGTDLRLRCYRALKAKGPWTRLRLETVLISIYAWDEASRRSFDEVFKLQFPETDALPAWLVRRLAGDDPEVPWDRDRFEQELLAISDANPARPRSARGAPSPASVAPAAARPKPADRRVHPALYVVCFVAVAGTIALNVVHRVGEPESPVRVVGVKPTSSVQPAAEPHVVTPDPPPEDKRADEDARQRALALTLGAILALGGASALLRRAARSLPEPPVIEPTGPSSARPHASAEPFRSEDLRKLAYDVGLTRDPEQAVLDVDATVARTARNGGFFEPVYGAGPAIPRLWIVQSTAIDPWARLLVERVAGALRDLGVPIDEPLRRANPTGTDLVLAIVDARRLRGRADAVAAAGGWLLHPHVAIVEARDPALWGPEIGELPFAPFVLDAPGISAALRAAHAARRIPAPKLDRPLPSLARLDEALPLAAACALAEPLDLAAIDDLRTRLFPEVPPLAVQRILSLEGAVADPDAVQFQPDLRARLVRRLSPEQKARVAEWQRARLERAVFAPGTREELARDRELALTRLVYAAGRMEGPGEAPPSVRSTVEASLLTLERQLAHPSLRARVEERVRALAPSLGALDELGAGIRARLGRLAASATTPPVRPWSTPHGLGANVGAAVLAVSGFGAFGGALWSSEAPQICATGRSDCGGKCYALDRDPANCGSCGRACAAGEACEASACRCPAGNRCGDTCVDLSSDDRHCGACDMACGADSSCVEGACVQRCPTPCGKKCPDLSRDPTNCGACGVVCGPKQLCREGRCTDVATCPHPCGNTCVESFENNWLHCGRCDNDCTQDPTRTGLCKRNACIGCREGWLNCNLDGSDGCEVDGRSDESNCGACGNACTASAPHALPFCAAGTCSSICEPQWGDCEPGAAGCETDLRTSAQHCGECNYPCPAMPHAEPSCKDSKCDYACAPGFGECNPKVPGCETDVRSDVANCGSCRHACVPGIGPNGGSIEPTCSKGICDFACTAFPGTAKCGQRCADTQSDPLNCGGCGVVCSANPGTTASCVAGGCKLACADPSRQLCPDGTCPDLASDPSHCGGCSTACATGPHAQSACTKGGCGPLVCDPGWSDCDKAPGCETRGKCDGTCGCGVLREECLAKRCKEPAPKLGVGDDPSVPLGGPDPLCEKYCNTEFEQCSLLCKARGGAAN